MKFCSPLIVTRDMERTKRFYRDVLDCEVVCDFGANVTLTGGFSVQTLETWRRFIGTDNVSLGGSAGELYFEEGDFDGFIKKLSAMPELTYVHPPKEHEWGQRAVRFYDPDGNIIEVGEELSAVARRFMDGGMTSGQTAERMGVSEEFIRELVR